MVFGPDPSTHSRCAIGGNIGNNSCGIHSVQAQLYGPGPRTSDNVEAMEIVTHDGARFWVGVGEEDQLERDHRRRAGARARSTPSCVTCATATPSSIRERYQPVDRLPRRVSGYNLDELLPERGFNVARALVGTESTCATTLQVKLKLTPALLERTLVVVEYDDDPGRRRARHARSSTLEADRPRGARPPADRERDGCSASTSATSRSCPGATGPRPRG